jgi:oxaloacetate decarboxylase gamma subunit
MFMRITEMLGQSGMMAIIGMGIVFSFLAILVFTVLMAGRLIQSLGLDKETKVKTSGGPLTGTANQQAIVAAIGAAVSQYRKDKA